MPKCMLSTVATDVPLLKCLAFLYTGNTTFSVCGNILGWWQQMSPGTQVCTCMHFEAQAKYVCPIHKLYCWLSSRMEYLHLLMHWRYCSLALNHWYCFVHNFCIKATTGILILRRIPFRLSMTVNDLAIQGDRALAYMVSLFLCTIFAWRFTHCPLGDLNKNLQK